MGARSPTATVETMAVPASHSQHPQPLLTFDVSTKPAPPSKNEMPAWAARLEEVLAEDTRRSTTAQGPVQAQMAPKSSVPSHRRMQFNVEDAAFLNPKATVYLSSFNTHSKGNTETPAMIALETLANHKSQIIGKVSACKLGIADTRHEGAHRGCIEQPMKDIITNDGHTRIDHDRKVKVITIRSMEHEMDLKNVATERELMYMSRIELNAYYVKALSAHKLWWEAKDTA